MRHEQNTVIFLIKETELDDKQLVPMTVSQMSIDALV